MIIKQKLHTQFICILISCFVFGCAYTTRHPIVAISIGPLTKENVVNIRLLAKKIAEDNDGRLADESEGASTKKIPPELALAISIKITEGELIVLTYDSLEPGVAFYGDPKSPAVQQLIEQTMDGLKQLQLPMRMKNDNELSKLPINLQLKFNKDIVRRDQ
jgi:hypothetical protein